MLSYGDGDGCETCTTSLEHHPPVQYVATFLVVEKGLLDYCDVGSPFLVFCPDCRRAYSDASGCVVAAARPPGSHHCVRLPH